MFGVALLDGLVKELLVLYSNLLKLLLDGGNVFVTEEDLILELDEVLDAAV